MWANRSEQRVIWIYRIPTTRRWRGTVFSWTPRRKRAIQPMMPPLRSVAMKGGVKYCGNNKEAWARLSHRRPSSGNERRSQQCRCSILTFFWRILKVSSWHSCLLSTCLCRMATCGVPWTHYQTSDPICDMQGIVYCISVLLHVQCA